MIALTMVLVVSSLRMVNSRDSDNVVQLQPDFGPAPNVTRVQVDSTAFLHCNVLNLQEENQVSSIYITENKSIDRCPGFVVVTGI